MSAERDDEKYDLTSPYEDDIHDVDTLNIMLTINARYLSACHPLPQHLKEIIIQEYLFLLNVNKQKLADCFDQVLTTQVRC